MTKILGISAFFHDSAAALIDDGVIKAAAQEERFTRKKHDSNYPFNAVEYVLKENGCKLNEVDFIVFFEKPFLKFERLLETYMAFAPRGFKSFLMAMPIWLREKLFQKKNLFNLLKQHDKNFNTIDKIKFSEHHFSHAASAFFPSPFSEALILTLDGVGEWPTSTVAIGKDNNIEIIKEIHFPHSLGLLYSAFTYYLGFKVNSGEYKIMGLAPYGQAKYSKIIKDNLIDIKQDGSFKINMRYFSYATDLKMTNKKFSELFKQPVRKPEKELLTQFHMDMAASIQEVTEEIVLRITKKLSGDYNIKNLCLAGGVALNCVANGKILKKNFFKNLWIQPAAGDAGGALGAALGYWYHELNQKRSVDKNDSMQGSYLGPKFSNEEVEASLISLQANFKKYKNDSELISVISNKINQKKIVGWFQGRMEFGPRALGARSILADPRDGEMQKKLNLKIKFRESFRPFAPSVLSEKKSDWFDLHQESPYMLIVSQVNNEHILKMTDEQKKLFGIEKLNIKRSSLPAITHIDYSARIQTVNGKFNRRYYDLLNEFQKISGCPVIINTSFNIRGEPIVCSVEDAYRCFMGTNLDVLACENYVMLKEEQNKDLLREYKSQFELD